MNTLQVPDLETIRAADDAQLVGLLAQVVAGYDDFLHNRPGAQDEVMELIADRLRDGAGPGSWDRILRSLGAYLPFGAEFAFVLAWVLTQPDSDAAIVSLEQRQPKGMEQVRQIVATHGEELRRSFAAWNRPPQDWSNLSREVYFDLLNNAYHLRLSIELYSGESIRIEGDAESFLGLTRFLVQSLRHIGGPGAFDQARVAEFLDDAMPLIEMLSAPDEETAQEASEAPQTPPTT